MECPTCGGEVWRWINIFTGAECWICVECLITDEDYDGTQKGNQEDGITVSQPKSEKPRPENC